MKKKKPYPDNELSKRERLHVLRRKPTPPALPLPPKVISSEQLKHGLEEKKREIQSTTEEVQQFFRLCPGVKEVEVPLTFDKEGKFLGIGTGGTLVLKVHVKVEKS